MNEHSCPDDIKALLSRLVDGEISDDERTQADEHLAACAPCRELLDLFRKNETLLSNALESEAFGNAIIESVVRSIRREGPPEAAPVEDGPLEWLRARPWLPLTAAAALLVGLGVLVVGQASEVRGLRVTVEASRASQLDFLKAAADGQTQYERLLRELRTADASAGSKHNTLAHVEDRGLVVRGSFDAREFSHYEVWRRGEKEPDFSRINTAKGEERLQRPEFLDRGAKPGQNYAYKFRAVRPDGEAVESAPIQMRVPAAGDLSPEQSVKVHCFDLAVTGDVGIFLLERVIEGRPVVEKFVVRNGEAIGGPAEVPGAGRVNFSTGLTLGRIEEAYETLSVSYAEPVLDDQGRPVIQKLENGTAVPVTRQHEVPLSIRPNLRASFRSDAGGEARLFKGSWLRVKAR